MNYCTSLVDFNICDELSDGLIGIKNLDKIGPIREIWLNRFLSLHSFQKIPFCDQLPRSINLNKFPDV